MALKKLLTIENNHPNYKDTIVYIKNARVELGQKLLNLSKQKYRQKNYEESIRLAKRAMEYFKKAQTKEAKQQLSKAQQLSAKALKAEIKRLRLMTVTTNNFICRTVHAYAVAISWQLTSLLPRAEICRKKCHYACDILGEGTVVSVIKTFERGYVTYAVIKVVKPGDGCVGVYTGDEGITSKQWLKPVKLPLKPEIKKLLHIYQSNS
jgi:tetratricopeptide (TPR) repeat protein